MRVASLDILGGWKRKGGHTRKGLDDYFGSLFLLHVRLAFNAQENVESYQISRKPRHRRYGHSHDHSFCQSPL
jgi:hypothetical protein